MGKKHVAANKKRWAKVSKEERSERMRAVVNARHSKSTKKEKKEIGIRLAESRSKKAEAESPA